MQLPKIRCIGEGKGCAVYIPDMSESSANGPVLVTTPRGPRNSDVWIFIRWFSCLLVELCSACIPKVLDNRTSEIDTTKSIRGCGS